jgi:hypothetical protein
VVMMVWIGMFTQTFLAPVSASTETILKESKMNAARHLNPASSTVASVGGNIHAH